MFQGEGGDQERLGTFIHKRIKNTIRKQAHSYILTMRKSKEK